MLHTRTLARRSRWLAAAAFATLALPAPAQPAPSVHLIWMGGDDCPPCVAWRRTELPKLQATEAFRKARFSYVVKTIKSAVPSRMFLPEEVKPMKDLLDAAGNGRGGSPQGALLVDGQVYDYFSGVRSAEQIEAMLRAAQTGAPYPFKRCLKVAPTGRACVQPA